MNDLKNLLQKRDNTIPKTPANSNPAKKDIDVSNITQMLSSTSLNDVEESSFRWFPETNIEFYNEQESCQENDFLSSSDDSDEEIDDLGTNINSTEYAHELKLFQEYQQKTGDTISTKQIDEDWKGEKYENPLPTFYTSYFSNFSAHVQNDPLCIVRWSEDEGEPIWYSEPPKNIDKCTQCNGDMSFEFQIMPAVFT